MNYSILKARQIDFLDEYVDTIYLLTNSDKSKTYQMVTNGLIGLGVILEGEAKILKKNNW